MRQKKMREILNFLVTMGEARHEIEKDVETYTIDIFGNEVVFFQIFPDYKGNQKVRVMDFSWDLDCLRKNGEQATCDYIDKLSIDGGITMMVDSMDESQRERIFSQFPELKDFLGRKVKIISHRKRITSE